MRELHAELDIHRFLFELGARLRDVADPDKVLRVFLRATAALMEADRTCIVTIEAGREQAEVTASQPAGATWDLGLFTTLLRGGPSELPRGTIFARVARRGRPWALLVLAKETDTFPTGFHRALARVGEAASEIIERLDRERLAEVRSRIDGKMMRELPPKDLYYQVLDGLHALTRYDHSAALWIWQPDDHALELVAEQIAWTKRRSPLIGRRVALTRAMAPLLGDGIVYGFDQVEGRWQEWTALGAVALAPLLDLSAAETEARPATGAMLCASLGSRRGPVGLLTLSALRPGTFQQWERMTVEGFVLLASLALQRARTLESLRDRMFKIERQSALGELARGVAHDINNALGEVVPLVQQIRAEAADGRLDPALLEQDLQRIEQSLQVSRSIFQRMLRFARGAARSTEPGVLPRAVDAVHDVLRDSFGRGRIRFVTRVAPDLAPLRCGQSDLERLLYNLLSNARDAMPDGGTLALEARAAGPLLELAIADQGTGMSPEVLREIERPFFTTKEHGTGLGLATCRSIVSEAGGELRIDSAAGAGTRVLATLAFAPGAADA